MRLNRRIVLRSIALAAVLAAAVSSVPANRLALVPGDAAPGMRGHDTQGNYVVVRYPEASVTLLNFWATWCVPCREEMPALQKLHRERSGDGLHVVGIHVGYVTDEDLAKFVAEVGVDYPTIRPDTRWLNEWGGISAMPSTFLVDRQGKLIRRYIGATPEQIEGLVYDVQAALEGRPLGPIIVPEDPSFVTEQDMPAPSQQQSEDR